MTLLLQLLWVYLILVQTRRLNARELVLSEGQCLKLNLDAEKVSKCARLPERPSQFFLSSLRFCFSSSLAGNRLDVFFFSLTSHLKLGVSLQFPLPNNKLIAVSAPLMQRFHVRLGERFAQWEGQVHCAYQPFNHSVGFFICCQNTEAVWQDELSFVICGSIVCQSAQISSNKRPYVYNSKLYFYILLH